MAKEDAAKREPKDFQQDSNGPQAISSSSGGRNSNLKLPSEANWKEYAVLPLRRRGCVTLTEIGTQHVLLDKILCLFLGIPGLVLSITHDFLPLWFRVYVGFHP